MALRKDAKIELMRQVPLFAGCSKRELAEIAQLADELDLPSGRELIRQGERGREFFVLADGTVEVSRDGESSALGPGDFFGEIALVSDVPRTATVTSTSPVRLLVITDRAFRNVLERSPGIQLKVLDALARRLAPQVL